MAFAAMAAPLAVMSTHRLVVSPAPIGAVSERYLCFCIDLGQIAEPTRFWNPLGAAGETLEIRGFPSYDFRRSRLRRMTSAFAPAYLRIGGTEADRAYYNLNGSTLDRPPTPYTSVLDASHVDEIGAFAKAVGFEVVFTVNAGWGARTDQGGWVSDQARSLMRYVRTRDLPFTIFELGNEPNAFPYLQKGLYVPPEQLATDLAALSAVRDDELPGALLAGPATAFFPAIGEVPCPVISFPPSLVLDYQRRTLAAAEQLVTPDIVTWHYYPGQSTRAIDLLKWRKAALAALITAALILGAAGAANEGSTSSKVEVDLGPLGVAVVTLVALVVAAAVLVHLVVTPVTMHSLSSPAVLDRAAMWGGVVRDRLSAWPPERRPQLWLGETGSAQAGGQAGVSGRWVGTLWWLDQLGQLAALEHSVQCRQTLSGSDYGLVDATTLEPTSEFWATVVWRRLMGEHVYASTAEGAPPTLRVYCHTTRKRAPSPRATDGGGLGARTCMAINLGEDPLGLALPSANTGQGAAKAKAKAGAFEVWLLKSSSLNATEIHINGQQPALMADGTVPLSVPGQGELLTGTLTVPSKAVAFFRERS
jgi:hypothetical protein